MVKEIEVPSLTGGVRPFPIEGRMGRERERLSGMTAAERKWRAQYLKDQYLSPNEPRVVPEMYYELRNPIRRAIAKPLDILFEALRPALGKNTNAIRFYTGKFSMMIWGVYFTAYYFKYNGHDWTREGGWNVRQNHPSVLPGHPDYPRVSDKTEPHHYASRGFNNSPI